MISPRVEPPPHGYMVGDITIMADEWLLYFSINIVFNLENVEFYPYIFDFF